MPILLKKANYERSYPRRSIHLQIEHSEFAEFEFSMNPIVIGLTRNKSFPTLKSISLLLSEIFYDLLLYLPQLYRSIKPQRKYLIHKLPDSCNFSAFTFFSNVK